MRALLDTHSLLWFVWDDPRLSAVARAQIIDPDAELFISAASAWEIVIKSQLGRLKLGADPDEFLKTYLNINAIDTLPIRLEHAFAINNLPAHHRDPFDRMIIAQAITENLPIITGDLEFRKYPPPVIW